MERQEKIYWKLRNEQNLESEPARKATPVAEYLYRSSRPEEGYRILNVQRLGQIWEGMKKRDMNFYFEGAQAFIPYAGMSRDKTTEGELDCIGIGLEVLAHIGWVQSCDTFKASLTAYGLRQIEGGAD